MKNYILVIDEGTTGVRSVIFDDKFEICGQCYEKIHVTYGEHGEVEQSGSEIYEKTVKTVKNVVGTAGITADDILCMGITTQRVTWLFWDKETGEPVADAVVWQDTRARRRVDVVKNDPRFQEMCMYFTPALKTSSLCVTIPYFLEQHPEVAKQLEEGKLLYGTIDTWLVWKFTEGKVFATDASNASTLGALDDKTLDWDFNLIHDYAGLPKEIFAEVKANSDDFGMMNSGILGREIPITGVAADQQAALFSQGCHEINTGKCTNGTGSFLTVNIGRIQPPLELDRPAGPIPRVGWKIGDDVYWMVEALCPTTGAVLEWVKDKLRLFDDISELEGLAGSVPDNGDVYFVPALTGLNSPYSDPTARASFMGVSGSSTREHFVRAALESVAYAVCGAFEMLQQMFGLNMQEVKISGGVSKSDIVAQYMANLLDMKVDRPASVEASALGAAEFAAIYMGTITVEDVRNIVRSQKIFVPDENSARCCESYQRWLKAVDRSSHWLE